MAAYKAAAASFALEAIAAPVHDVSELESVVAAQARGLNSGLIVMPDGFLNVHRAETVSLAARYRLPAVYPWRFFAELGGLLSYGSESICHLTSSSVILLLRSWHYSRRPAPSRSSS